MQRFIEGHFKITHKVLAASFLTQFLEELCAFDNGRWMPERYNSFEPIKKAFRKSRFQRSLISGFTMR